MAYTTSALVLAELGLASSVLTASSIPSTSDVSTWITEAKAEIDETTGRVWESTAMASSAYEYYDYDGSGFIKLYNCPVISIQSLEWETQGIGTVTSSGAVWSTLTEGRGTDASYLLWKDIGLVEFHPNNSLSPTQGKQNIRAVYTYGESSVPSLVQRLATLVVAERYITSYVNNSSAQLGGSVSVGTISVTDPSPFSVNRLVNLRSEKERLFAKLGTQRTYGRYYNWGSSWLS